MWASGFDGRGRSRPELLEGGVALERLGERRHAAVGAELVVGEPTHTAEGMVTSEGVLEGVQRAVLGPSSRARQLYSALGSSKVRGLA